MHAESIAGSLLSVYQWSTVQTEYKNNACEKEKEGRIYINVNLLISPQNYLHEVTWKLRV